ncbi:hypothetical protein JOF56_007857 [Kibdelosporangium banguiense]|uniref:DUF3558 domain-containing protein n=1 Tax=Kibdelosporangium banguiense TaxID=1365924 RepID=A0ABS4TST5_9PSEU|nr:DUF3558 family protein [Kibdelosporangium banguiense]MBP2327472.1 hypothetical protein [Kibdelosporangium banguiense]
MRGQWLGAAIMLMVLTGCTGDPPPQPPPTVPVTSAPSVPSGPTLPSAPPVPSPLNATVFETEPCRSLTGAQQQQFGLDSGTVKDAAVEGKSCFYRYPGPMPQAVSVTYASKSTNGLTIRYIEHARGAYKYWEPATVDGYPAAGYDPGIDLQFCSFAVGLTDSLFFWVTAPDNAGAGRCSTAKAVATAVVATIRANQ